MATPHSSALRRSSARNGASQTPMGAAWNDGLGRAGLRSAQVLLVLLLVGVAVYGLLQVTLVVIPLLLALILAAAISPFVNWLRRHGWPGALATVTSFLLLLSLFGGLVTGIVFAIRSEWDSLVDQAVAGFNELYELIQSGPLQVDSGMFEEARDAVVDFATSSTAGTSALAGISAATNFITGFLLMAVVLFFFLKDGKIIWQFVLRWFPEDRKDKARLAGARTMEVLGSYVRGTAIVALVDSVCIGIALFVLDVPLALPLAVIVFVGAFIPLVGATAAGVLSALIALVANGPVVALIVVIVIIAVNQLEGNLLQPVVMGRSLSIHALVILLALAAGTILAGIIGAILAVPLAAVAWAVVKVWIGEDQGDPAEVAELPEDPEDADNSEESRPASPEARS